MRGITIRDRWTQLRERSAGRRYPPWIDFTILGAQKRHGMDHSLRAEATTEATTDFERASPSRSTMAAQGSGQDQQQKTAISAWEGEGGRTAAPKRVRNT